MNEIDSHKDQVRREGRLSAVLATGLQCGKNQDFLTQLMPTNDSCNSVSSPTFFKKVLAILHGYWLCFVPQVANGNRLRSFKSGKQIKSVFL
jgi:hypothetical protein